MTDSRDHCPDCDHKLHPQEMASLLQGRKLDCWYCGTTLKARSALNLEQIGQTSVAIWALVASFLNDGGASFWPLAAAGAIFVFFQVMPPGLLHGDRWVRIVSA